MDNIVHVYYIIHDTIERAMGDIQRLVVMRHGERLDSLDWQWKKRALRPYDTPLTKPGEKEVFRVAQSFAGKVIDIIYDIYDFMEEIGS